MSQPDNPTRMNDTAKVAELTAAQGQLGATVDATVFGIAVGFVLPNLPSCDGFAADPDARLCVDGDVGAFARFLDRWCRCRCRCRCWCRRRS